MTYEEKLAKARKLRDLLWGKTQPKADAESDKGTTEPSDGDDKNESK